MPSDFPYSPPPNSERTDLRDPLLSEVGVCESDAFLLPQIGPYVLALSLWRNDSGQLLSGPAHWRRGAHMLFLPLQEYPPALDMVRLRART